MVSIHVIVMNSVGSLSVDFPAGTRHVFSLRRTDYYHTLIVDSQNANILFLGAV